MSIATRFVSSTARPRLDLKGCVFYAPLWRPDLGGVTSFTTIGDNGIPTHLCTATGTTYGIQGRTYASGDYITAPNATALDFTTTDFSGWAWVKPTSVTAAQMLISHGATNADGWFMLLNTGTTSGRLFIRTNQSGANQATQSVDNAIPAGVWSFLSFTRIGTAVTVYRNGADNTVDPGTHTDPVATTRTVKIGINDDLVANPFVGVFGEAAIFNRGLTAQNHLQLYNATKWRYT